MGLFGSSEKENNDESEGLVIESDKESLGLTCKHRSVFLDGEKIKKIMLEDCRIDSPFKEKKGIIKVKKINIF